MSLERQIMPAVQPERGGCADLATQTLEQDIDCGLAARSGAVERRKIARICGVRRDDR